MPIMQWLPHDMSMVTQMLIRVLSMLRGIKEENDKRECIRTFSVKRWSSFVLIESKKFFADCLPALQDDKQAFL